MVWFHSSHPAPGASGSPVTRRHANISHPTGHQGFTRRRSAAVMVLPSVSLNWLIQRQGRFRRVGKRCFRNPVRRATNAIGDASFDDFVIALTWAATPSEIIQEASLSQAF